MLSGTVLSIGHLHFGSAQYTVTVVMHVKLEKKNRLEVQKYVRMSFIYMCIAQVKCKPLHGLCGQLD